VQGGIPAVLVYEDLEHLTPYMHTADDVVGLSLNSPELLEANARLSTAAIATLAGLLGNPEVEFIRGDANADGAADVSDAVRTLVYLFLGGVEPACPKSLDADDSGTLDVTDAVFELEYLFLGGPAPASPFPDCGPDPTGDELSCLSHAACE
jgi:hypothetical protein